MIYKAQWPLAGLPQVCVYPAEDDGKPGFSRRCEFIPCSKKLRDEMFQGRYIKVYFEGEVLPGGVYQIKEFVNHELWDDKDPLTGELVP